MDLSYVYHRAAHTVSSWWNVLTVIIFIIFIFITSSRSIVISVCVCVCLSLCLPGRLSRKQHVQSSSDFLYMLPVAVARSSSNDCALCYVLQVLRMTSCFYIMERINQNQWRREFHPVCQVAAPGATSAVFDCILWKNIISKPILVLAILIILDVKIIGRISG